MDVARRLEVVEQENLLLREKIATLEAILLETAPLPVEWSLTGQEAKAFGLLVNRELASKDALMTVLYGNRSADQEVPDQKIIDVFICKIRRKLKPFGVRIETLYGRGWALAPECREDYRRHVEGLVAKRVAA